MSRIFERIRQFNLPAGQYAVFGSSLLDVWGLRPAADLDIIATPELYAKLKRDGWEEKQGNGFAYLVKDDANVTTIQERPTDGDYLPDRLRLIKDAVLIEGLPFVRVEEVIACKRAYGRPKDLSDIELLEKHLALTDPAELYQAAT